MKMIGKTRLGQTAATAICFALLAFPALAQQAPGGGAVRMRGDVVKVDGQMLTIKASDGTASTYQMNGSTIIAVTKPAQLSDIKAGDFVASGATRGADGKLHSNELRIFPPALRGAGEGQRPMDQPNTMMTNADVTEVAAAAEGRSLKVKFPGGTSELIVDPTTPIRKLEIVDAKTLKAGTDVTVQGNKGADGTVTLTRITANYHAAFRVELKEGSMTRASRNLFGCAAAAIGAVMFLPSALAQQSSCCGLGMQGPVITANNQTLTLTAPNGTALSYSLSAATIVTVPRIAAPADIMVGDFIGSAAVRGNDGKLHARELRILPEALRGDREGQRPLGTAGRYPPNSMITYATVSEVTTEAAAQSLKLAFRDGTSELIVDPATPVSRLEIVEARALRPGTDVTVRGDFEADGTVTLTRVTAN